MSGAPLTVETSAAACVCGGGPEERALFVCGAEVGTPWAAQLLDPGPIEPAARLEHLRRQQRLAAGARDQLEREARFQDRWDHACALRATARRYAHAERRLQHEVERAEHAFSPVRPAPVAPDPEPAPPAPAQDRVPLAGLTVLTACLTSERETARCLSQEASLAPVACAPAVSPSTGGLFSALESHPARDGASVSPLEAASPGGSAVLTHSHGLVLILAVEHENGRGRRSAR